VSQQTIGIGAVDQGQGDTPFVAFGKVNANFTELYGRITPLIGATTATVAAGSTVFLGCNAAQAAQNNTAFMVAPTNGVTVIRADIAFGLAPGAGQSFTFTLLGNGAPLTAAAGSANPLVASGTGVFSGSILIATNTTLAQFQQLVIQLTTSASAAATNFRYAISVVPT